MSRRDATEGGFKHVFAILRSLYPRVQTLQEFADGLVFSDGRKPVLLDEKDGARFQKLAGGLIICACAPPQQLRVPAQLGTLPEVLAFTLNHIKRKKLRNVLGFGYQCSDVAAGSDPFRFHGDVSQTAASISTSELWKRINQRLGTEVTRYLLQDCAIFATVPPSCLLQVCGEPVYDLLLPRTWSGFNFLYYFRKFERLPLMQLMWKMKVKACHWLGLKKRHCASEHRYREWICGQFLGWMLSGYVVGLVKALFYVTESMGQKHTLRFYRGEVWIRLQEMAFRAHLSKGQWRALSPSQALKFPKTAVTSRIRFIPKVNSMRPITRLSGPRDSLRSHRTDGVRLLQNVLSVCVREAPGPMGSTVWGWQGIHRVLKEFGPQQKSSPRPLYFVKVDVSGAYDSLPHQKLVEVLGEVLRVFSERSFFVRQYARVWNAPHLGLRKHFCTRAEMSEPLNMKGFVVEEQAGGTLHDAILVERHSSEVRGGDVFQFFQKMLSSYIIHHDNKMFRQVCGIPQGSSVSALLCNLCYGHMENSLLKGIAKGGCLMRLVDDFLLITPHLSKATEFLTTLLAGVPDYGCQINPQKVAVNFPVCVEWLDSGVSVLPSCCLFPWCGLLLDTHSLDVYKDYSRYDGLSLRYSLTLGSAHSPTAVIKKLLSVLSLKCTDIFLDLRMNSVEAVYRSLYKLILLQALRFHACVRSLPLGQNVESNPCFFLKMIWTMSRVTNRLIRHINKGRSAGFSSDSHVNKLHAPWLSADLLYMIHQYTQAGQ
uniref:Telomerase reverse transcriptase n=1 Tax=Cyprinus carpio TaxID=7962 RepID=A0A8C2EIU0_CYPCA